MLGVVAELRPGVARRRDAVGGGPDRGAGAGLGGEHLDARALAPRLRARHQPPDPELGREARSATHATPYIAIGIAAVLAFALAIPGDIEFLAGRLRVRGAAGGDDRPPLDHPAAGDRPRSRAALLGAVQRSLARRAACRCRRCSRRWSARLAWVSVIAFHEEALLVGGGWMAVRPRLLRRLPAGWSRGPR